MYSKTQGVFYLFPDRSGSSGRQRFVFTSKSGITVILESAGITDVGKKRKANEDALFLDDDLGLYVVADGMGGHRAGEVASSIVVQTIRDDMIRFKANGQGGDPETIDETLSPEANQVLYSIEHANTGVNQSSRSNNAYRGMGSTVSITYFTANSMVVANVGDSPIYLVHNGSIEELSVPHTVMAEQAAMNPGGARQLGAEFRHMLTQAMGIEETVSPDICEMPYFKGDRLVLCSDGLSDKVSPDEILGVVSKMRPKKACTALVDMANERGGDDNITIIILRVLKTVNRGGFSIFKPFSWLAERMFNYPLKKIF